MSVQRVARFFLFAKRLPGALAVHCKAGLGRTGTLITAYLIKHNGFTARQAIGWLRVVRPGSAIGAQQRLLCAREPAPRHAGRAFRTVARAGRGGAVAAAIASAMADAAPRLSEDTHSDADLADTSPRRRMPSPSCGREDGGGGAGRRR